MAIKPYLCGRCGEGFHSASKYCPACGAILSLPLGSRARAAAQAAPGSLDAFRRSGWFEISIIMVLLFVALYYGMRAMRARGADAVVNVVTEVRYVDAIDNTVYARQRILEAVPADKLKDYDPQTVVYGLSPENRKKYGNVPLDVARAMAEREKDLKPEKPERDDDRGVAVNIKVEDGRDARRADGDWERAESLAAMLAPTPAREREPAVRPGMTQSEVLGIWGKPLSRRGPFARDGGYYERWDYGDPVYNLDVGTRFVEFGEDRRVAVVRDGGVALRKPKDAPARSGR